MAVTQTFNVAGGQFGPIAFTSTGTLGDTISVEVAASTTNQQFNIGIDISELQSIFLFTDGALTIKTNSSGSPDDTWVMAANFPLLWASGMPNANPVSVDVTKFYLTNATGAAVNLYGIVNQALP